MGPHASGFAGYVDCAALWVLNLAAKSELPSIAGSFRPATMGGMRVIPVIDLLGGQVVRGVGGRRDEYRPIVSSLVASSEPAAVAVALQEWFGLPRIYVADLDAITGSLPGVPGGARDLKSWQAIGAAGWALTIDAGLQTAEEVVSLSELLRRDFSDAEFVIGLESLRSLADLAELKRSDVDLERAVFSLDLKAGVPLTQDSEWRSASAIDLMSEVHRCGIRRAIVLDLADVGSGQGTSTLPLVRQLHEQFPDLEIIAGGGVRGLEDLRQLQTAGATAALVASALHDGRLTPADLRSLSNS